MDPTYFGTTLRKVVVVAAWISVAVVAYATLSKVEFVYRIYYWVAPFLNYPSMRTYASIEHVLAYAVIGALFCAVYPHSVLRICLLLFLCIVCLEVLQTLRPDRDGTVRDAIEKMIGGATGVFLVTVALRWKKTRRISQTADS